MRSARGGMALHCGEKGEAVESRKLKFWPEMGKRLRGKSLSEVGGRAAGAAGKEGCGGKHSRIRVHFLGDSGFGLDPFRGELFFVPRGTFSILELLLNVPRGTTETLFKKIWVQGRCQARVQREIGAPAR
jgi:hypothetical protein